ncbi:MAG TPA: glycosyltransferase [Prosthecobacter sp.]|nr:glycosyltransferase [Prosthecobacter sp.]
MKICLFYHSLLSDWNHGNAHFLRGIASELHRRGHAVEVYEPRDAWSVENLVAEYGEGPLKGFKKAYPGLRSIRYDRADLDLEAVLRGADLVLVHEWNDHSLVRRIGESRRRHPFVLLFHDTHHRLITRPEEMRAYDLTDYDGVLAYGKVLRDIYLREELTAKAWTWHEAADVSRFKPAPHIQKEGDLVWIGNWGDDERVEELHEFLIRPAQALGLKAAVYGVRYPADALEALSRAGIEYRGWLPNFNVPEVFARYRLTVHVPRRPYVHTLPGIPTIRPFEAMACGIPLVMSPWNDAENLFTEGKDYLMVQSGAEMREALRQLLADETRRAALATHASATIQQRHTCSHRVDELLAIHHSLRPHRQGAKPQPARTPPTKAVRPPAKTLSK